MKVSKGVLLSLTCLFILVGCTGKRMYEAPAISAPMRAPDAEIRRAVKTALLREGWRIEHDWAEATYAKINHGHHNARVRVRYSGNRVHIEYVSSQYLKYRIKKGEPVIHQLYNSWVMELEEEIQFQIAAIRLEGAEHRHALRTDSIHQVTYSGEYHAPPTNVKRTDYDRVDVPLETPASFGKYQGLAIQGHANEISEKDIIPSRMIQHNPYRTRPSAAVGSSHGAVNLDEAYY